MATTIFKQHTKYTVKGVPFKKQPPQPSDKYRKLLKQQRIDFKEYKCLYCESLQLNITTTARFNGGDFFGDMAHSQDPVTVFKF